MWGAAGEEEPGSQFGSGSGSRRAIRVTCRRTGVDVEDWRGDIVWLVVIVGGGGGGGGGIWRNVDAASGLCAPSARETHPFLWPGQGLPWQQTSGQETGCHVEGGCPNGKPSKPLCPELRSSIQSSR